MDEPCHPRRQYLPNCQESWLIAVPSERQEGGRGPHLILERLFQFLPLNTPPLRALWPGNRGSYPQEIKIPNGSICQALGPATKADSVPAKSPQVGGLQPPLCVSSEVSLLNSRGQQNRVLRSPPNTGKTPGSFHCTSLFSDSPS